MSPTVVLKASELVSEKLAGHGMDESNPEAPSGGFSWLLCLEPPVDVMLEDPVFWLSGVTVDMP